ncbi:MAG: hypothetical protein B1H03_02510 [Planctomycetales bacterium 4484_113]|nr:MAG: hypothetical protein B1H03_02510 [Planctomycetales bacterium 4484_113]
MIVIGFLLMMYGVVGALAYPQEHQEFKDPFALFLSLPMLVGGIIMTIIGYRRGEQYAGSNGVDYA